MNTRLHLGLLCLLVLSAAVGCRNRTQVEVIDLNKVLDIYDQVLKSKESSSSTSASSDPTKAKPESTGQPTQTDEKSVQEVQQENTQQTQEFLKLFAEALNNAKLIKSFIGVDMLPSGIIRGFVDRDKNGTKATSEPELFTIEFDKEANRVIATQKVANKQYRRDHYYRGGYTSYLFYHHMRSSMYYRQNSYYSPSRPRPNYSSFSMSSPSYHSSAVSHAQTTARRSSRSSYRSSSARGFGRSGSFSGGK